MNNQQILDNAPEGAHSFDMDNQYYDGYGNRLNKEGAWCESDSGPAYPRAIRDIRRIVELESQAQWISVEDRLPDEGSWVLAESNNHPVVLFFDGENSTGLHWLNDGDWSYPVTHWMPLPTPPSGGEL